MKKQTLKVMILSLIFMGAVNLAIGQINFSSEKIISSICGGASAVFACDIDGDSDLDVLAAAPLENKIVWYENDGFGSFGPQQVITTQARTAVDVFAFDMDGDNDMDVLSASYADNKIAWYENDGNGNFGEQLVISDSAYGAQSVYACDINGDLYIDVLSASITDQKIVLYINNGSQNFETQVILTDSAENAYSVEVFDLEGDGDLDVFSPSNGDRLLGIFLNDGTGYFSPGPEITANDVRAVFACDINDDGDLDILASDFSWSEIYWHENYDNDHFSDPQVISTSASGAEDVYAIDLDGDHDFDVLSASYHDNKIAWHENDGSGNFGQQQVISGSAVHANAVYACDIDGDGDMDVLSASSGDHKIAWYENSPPPDITTQPADQSACENSDTHFQLTAAFAESYQWQVDAGSGFSDLSENTLYSGVQTNDLQITGVTAAMSGYTYRCILSNTEGESISEASILTVLSTAEITTQPVTGTVVCQGAADITLEVVAISAISYQWYFEGNEIADATNSTLSVTAEPVNSGSYYCMIQCGSIQSNNASVLIQAASTLTLQPAVNTVACEGDPDIQLEVDASGSGTITYQWNYNGEEIPGAINSTLDISTEPDNSGTYTCTVTGDCGIVVSDDAVVNIQPATSITNQATTNIEVCEGDTEIQLEIDASGTGTISYQWNHESEEITGATNSTLNISTNPDNSGTYYCIVTGQCGSVESDDAIISIHPTYLFTENELICSGSDFTFPDNTTQTNITSQIIYTSHLQSVSGCDSIIETTLNIHSVDISVSEDGTMLSSGNSGAQSYQWINCNNNFSPVSGATGQQFTPTADGDYAVIINDGTCSDTSMCYTVTVTGIDHNPEKDIAIYPNPTNGIIHIAGPFIQEVELKSIKGQSLMNFEVKNGKVQFDLGSYPGGLYFIEILTNEGIVVKKILLD